VSEARYVVGDVFAELAKIPDGSIDFIVTSPPFLALRSYLPADHPMKHREIGSEASPAVFLSTLLALTREWRRVLAPHGSIAVELGDTYSGAGGYGSPDSPNPAYGAERFGERWEARTAKRFKRKDDGWPLAKSLCGIPTLYAWSLAYGRNLLEPADTIDPWRIRNVVVWHRPNPPVGALGDKVRPSTSYITVATVAADRWFDLDAERTEHTKPNGNGMTRVQSQRTTLRLNEGQIGYYNEGHPAGAPPLDCWFDEADGDDVWTIPTQPYAGAHYATWPIRLASRLVNLMCPRQVCTVCGTPRRRITQADEATRLANRERTGFAVRDGRENGDATYRSTAFLPSAHTTLGWSDCGHDSYRNGITLDPFAGSGTTLAAASGLGRDSIGIDLDPRNLDLARARVGMFLVEGAA
jgi:SAM-dependent methyltransferase